VPIQAIKVIDMELNFTEAATRRTELIFKEIRHMVIHGEMKGFVKVDEQREKSIVNSHRAPTILKKLQLPVSTTFRIPGWLR
jgi:hypothetical protein